MEDEKYAKMRENFYKRVRKDIKYNVEQYGRLQYKDYLKGTGVAYINTMCQLQCLLDNDKFNEIYTLTGGKRFQYEFDPMDFKYVRVASVGVGWYYGVVQINPYQYAFEPRFDFCLQQHIKELDKIVEGFKLTK